MGANPNPVASFAMFVIPVNGQRASDFKIKSRA